MIYTNFSIFKNSYKKEDKHPDYVISAKDESGKYVKIGGAWKRQMSNGETYLSCNISGVNPAPVLTPQESQQIKNLKEMEQANKELDVVANEQFDNW